MSAGTWETVGNKGCCMAAVAIQAANSFASSSADTVDRDWVPPTSVVEFDWDPVLFVAPSLTSKLNLSASRSSCSSAVLLLPAPFRVNFDYEKK